MTESQTEETVEAPFVMGQSVTPPTEIQTEVMEKVGYVSVRFYCNSRTVDTTLCLPPEEATQLAEQITDQVEQLDDH